MSVLDVALRVLLVAGSLITLVFMLGRIRTSKVQIRDAIFWIIFSLLLLVLSVFPDIALYASRLFGIASPINFVYLFIIFILLIKLFSTSLQLSRLDARIRQLAQKLALDEKNMADTTSASPAKPDEE